MVASVLNQCSHVVLVSEAERLPVLFTFPARAQSHLHQEALRASPATPPREPHSTAELS